MPICVKLIDVFSFLIQFDGYEMSRLKAREVFVANVQKLIDIIKFTVHLDGEIYNYDKRAFIVLP